MFFGPHKDGPYSAKRLLDIAFDIKILPTKMYIMDNALFLNTFNLITIDQNVVGATLCSPKSPAPKAQKSRQNLHPT